VASDLSVRELKTAIRSMDEHYGRPRRIRIVKAIPFLPNGKIDRQRVDQLLFAPRLSRTEDELTTAPRASHPPDL
jgi:acyl-CoA synthetase (AMP-forming)/AMP-acid ligase II